MPKKPSLAQADKLRTTTAGNGAPAVPQTPAKQSRVGETPKPATARAPVAVASYKAPSRKGKAAVTTFVEPEFLKRLKRCALEHEQSQDSLLHEALSKLLQERGF